MFVGVDVLFESCELWMKAMIWRRFQNKMTNRVQVLRGLSMSLLCFQNITSLINTTPIFPVGNPLLLTAGEYTSVPSQFSVYEGRTESHEQQFFVK